MRLCTDLRHIYIYIDVANGGGQTQLKGRILAPEFKTPFMAPLNVAAVVRLDAED